MLVRSKGVLNEENVLKSSCLVEAAMATATMEMRRAPGSWIKVNFAGPELMTVRSVW